MPKRAFLIFFVILAFLALSMIGFIQSERFAKILKEVAFRALPQDLGIQGDFSEIEVHFLPPVVSVRNPKITVDPGNALGLPAGSRVMAERIDFRFLPLQMAFSGARVDEIIIENGEIALVVDDKSTKIKKLNWDELYQFSADAISAINCKISVSGTEGHIIANFFANMIRLSQWTGRGGLGYELELRLQDYEAEKFSGLALPSHFRSLTALGNVNILGGELSVFELDLGQFKVNAKGAIKGDLLTFGDLPFDATIDAQGELKEVASFLLPKTEVLGQVAMLGKLSGKLMDIDDSLKFDGQLLAEKIHIGSWTFDSAELDASVALMPGTDLAQVDIRKAFARSTVAPRLPPHQVGSGGGIRILPGKFRISRDSSIPVGIEFEQAHLHWLVGPGAKKLFPLDTRIDGKTEATIKITESGWFLSGVVDFKIPELQLDNQKLGVEKRLNKVLSVQNVRVNGPVRIDEKNVQFEKVEISLKNSRFELSGAIHYDTGYDLSGIGTIDLSDIGQLAEGEISGSGELALRVHGPSKAVLLDFDVNLKDSNYLGLHLGELKGTITWEDDPEILRFKAIELKQGSTAYRGDGFVDTAGSGKLDLKFQFEKGEIHDLLNIFENLVKPFWWFPSSLTGPFSGTIDVGGAPSLDRLKVTGDLISPSWDFMDESFKGVSVKGGFDSGKYFIEKASASKRTGHIEGAISFQEKSGLDWKLETSGLSVRDLDHVARVDIPIQGDLEINSSGSGHLGDIRSSTKAKIRNLTVRGVSIPLSELSVTSAAGAATVIGSLFGGQGIFDGVYDFRKKGKSRLRGELHDFDFSPFILLLNPSLIHDPALEANLSGAIELDFESGNIELASGKIMLSKFLLAKTGVIFRQSSPVSTNLNVGSFDIKEGLIKGPKGEIRISLSGQKAILVGLVVGDVDLAVSEFLSSSIRKASGIAILDLRVAGTIKDPDVSGTALISGGEVQIDGWESPFEKMTGTLRLQDNKVAIKDLKTSLAGGRVITTGQVELHASQVPTLDIFSVLSGSRVKVYPFQHLLLHGNVRVHGSKLPYNVDGDLIVDSGLSKEKILDRPGALTREFSKYMPLEGTVGATDRPIFNLNIHAKADKGIVVQNDLFDAEMKGDITVLNTIAQPRLLGTAEAIKGKLIFKERDFEIQSAHVHFDNPTVLDPSFDLTASTTVNQVAIQLFASGKPSSFKPDFTSNPPMQPAEILQLIALGFTSEDMQRLKTDDRTVVEQGEAASLLLHSTGFNREVKEKTGFEVGVQESIDAQSQSSAFSPENIGDTSAAPKIVIKRKLTKNVDLSVGGTVGVGTRSEQEVNTEVRVTPGVSVIGVWNQFSGESEDQGQDYSYGVDLKFQKKFK